MKTKDLKNKTKNTTPVTFENQFDLALLHLGLKLKYEEDEVKKCDEK